MGYGPLARFKGESLYWARINPKAQQSEKSIPLPQGGGSMVSNDWCIRTATCISGYIVSVDGFPFIISVIRQDDCVFSIISYKFILLQGKIILFLDV